MALVDGKVTGDEGEDIQRTVGGMLIADAGQWIRAIGQMLGGE